MKYFFLFIFIIPGLVTFVACDDDGLDAYSYGNCKTGDRRCTGTKLEVCTDYNEWMFLADCSESGGECIYEKGNYYCSEEVEETPDKIYEWEDEEEGQDDGGSQQNDSFWTTSDEEDVDDSDDQDDSDQSDESEVSDETLDEDVSDEDADDSECDEDVVPVCGNGVLECDEICEKNDVKDCVEIDPVKYTAGKAICDDTCKDYNTVTCVN